MMHTLREWITDNQPSDEMLYKQAFQNQIAFVRDILSALLARNGEDYRNLVKVAGTHRSKSIVLPVYYLLLTGDKESGKYVSCWMRDNFYNWNLSVESSAPLDLDFLGCVSDEMYDYCYCEGMEQHKFPCYGNDKQHFTVCLRHSYDLYTFFRVLRKHLGIKCEE